MKPRPNSRETRRASLLRWARLMWHDIMDGTVPHDAWHMNEIDKLLKRAKATREDL